MTTTPAIRLTTLAALLVGVAIMALGTGLQSSLIGVRASAEGWGQGLIGIVQGAYFAGYAAGSLFGARLIQRAGHVNAFAALASIASISTLSHALIVDPVAWTGFRAATGLCHAGLMVVAESWLNAASGQSTRGRVLAVYTVVTMAAVSISQLLLLVADPQGPVLFALVSILISGSLVPLVLSRAPAPARVRPLRLRLGRVYAASPLGAIGCFLVGIAISAFLSLGAVYAVDHRFDEQGVAVFMFVGIAGGMALQLPIGLLSDRADRRLTILGVCLLAIAACVPLALLNGEAGIVHFVMVFIVGGTIIPLYSLLVAVTNDRVDPEDTVMIASGLLFLYALGSLIGPLLGGQAMRLLGAGALFWLLAAVHVALLAVTAVRLRGRGSVAVAEQSAFVARTASTPVQPNFQPGVHQGSDAPE